MALWLGVTGVCVAQVTEGFAGFFFSHLSNICLHY